MREMVGLQFSVSRLQIHKYKLQSIQELGVNQINTMNQTYIIAASISFLVAEVY